MNSKSFKASQSSLSSSSDFQEMQNLNNNNGNKPPMPPPSVTFGRRTSSGRYVNYSRDSRDDLDSEIGSGEFMNYTVHIPPTPDNQPMDPSISQKVEEQYVSNSLFTGGFNNVTRAHLMDKVIESEINHPQMAGSKGSSCAVPGCDGKVMSDERGLDILPCECDFKICRDCYVDAVKTGNGICPGCKEPYHNTDLDELARDSGRPLPLPPPGAGGISLSRDDLDSEIGSGEFMNYERSGRIRKSVQLRSGFLGRLNDEEDDDHPFAEEHKRAKFNTSTVLQWLSLYLILGALLSTLTTQLLVFISSQLLLVAFILRNTCKTVFEGIFFLFVMHPFDVGDLCEIEGVQVIVEEMNILDTVFLSFDNQKIIYPNNVLSTKPIRKYGRCN